MYVHFISISSADALNYLNDKWTNSASLGPFEVFEKSLASLTALQENSKPLSFVSAETIPKHSSSHVEIASRLLNEAMPLIELEELIVPDCLDVLAEDTLYFPAGTVVLKRETNFSKHCALFPCVKVIDGVVVRGKSTEADETVLSTLQNSVLTADYDAFRFEDNSEKLADPITTSAVASTIVLGLLSGAMSTIGAKAFGWAIKELGVDDFLGNMQLTYDQLIDALKLQSRADFRRDIRVRTAAFLRLLDDYNSGAAHPEKLLQLYNEIRQITAWVEEDFAEVDRVHILAWAQAQYFAVMQEQAEYYRGKDPAKLKSFYAAMCLRAAKESLVLKRIKEQAYANRMGLIRGLLSRPHPVLSTHEISWFEDKLQPRDPLWEAYEIECIEWINIRPGIPKCVKTRPTKKGNDTLKDMQGRLDRHRAWVHSIAIHALRGIDETIANFEKLSKIDIPPPPPK